MKYHFFNIRHGRFFTHTLLLVLSLVSISNVWAAKITVHYEGEVTKVDDPLKSQFAVGDKISGDLAYYRHDHYQLIENNIPGIESTYDFYYFFDYGYYDPNGLQAMSTSYSREGAVTYEMSANKGSIKRIVVDAQQYFYESTHNSGHSVEGFNLVWSRVTSEPTRDGDLSTATLTFSNGQSKARVLGKLNSIEFTNFVNTRIILDNKWIQIGLNVSLPAESTVADIIGDDISAPYGEKWVVYNYQTSTNTYKKLNLTDVMLPGNGYWIIQATGKWLVIDMPDASTNANWKNSPACSTNDAGGCMEIPLDTNATDPQWQMISYPYPNPSRTNSEESRIVTSTASSDCFSGCTLTEANEKGLIHTPLYRYDGSSYQPLTTQLGFTPSHYFQPFGAAWIAVLPAANGQNPKLLIPGR